ncbi:MAG: chorismate mutase [Pseudomonadales bacterium]|jgi:chorismate mutase|nr:chorismate mutase [Pseudomonadales bacterium]
MPTDSTHRAPPELRQLRDSIDQIDAEILDALVRRFAVTKQVGLLKAAHNLDSVDPVREQEKLARLRQLAKQKGLSEDFVQRLFQHVFDEVVRNHRSYLRP